MWGNDVFSLIILAVYIRPPFWLVVLFVIVFSSIGFSVAYKIDAGKVK